MVETMNEFDIYSMKRNVQTKNFNNNENTSNKNQYRTVYKAQPSKTTITVSEKKNDKNGSRAVDERSTDGVRKTSKG